MIQEEREPGISVQSETEGALRATVVSDLHPATEVAAQITRRRHTEKFKREVVAKVSELRQSDNGEIGGYLRSKGLYASTVAKWAKQFKQESGISGRDKNSKEALELRIKSLEKELLQTKKKLEKSELIIEFQKKVSEFLKINEQ